MQIILIRHAQSVLNQKHTHQFPTTPLSEKGLKQAKSVARRLSGLDVDLIVSSDYTRTSQTADFIAKELGKKAMHSALFRENQAPTKLRGKSTLGKEHMAYDKARTKHIHEKSWHYADEENFYDLFNRAKKAINYLKGLKKERVVVVLHSGIARFLLAYMVFGKELTPEVYRKMNYAFHMHNTAISILAEDKEYKVWRVAAWNDHAHDKEYLIPKERGRIHRNASKILRLIKERK